MSLLDKIFRRGKPDEDKVKRDLSAEEIEQRNKERSRKFEQVKTLFAMLIQTPQYSK